MAKGGKKQSSFLSTFRALSALSRIIWERGSGSDAYGPSGRRQVEVEALKPQVRYSEGCCAI